MQRNEKRPSANQSILLTLLFIYFLSPSATAQLPVCVRDGESGWDTGRATEDLSACNCSSPISFLLPYYPSLLWSSHIASNPLLLFCFVQKKKKRLMYQIKITQGFLVLTHDARATVRKLEPSAKPRLNTDGKVALLPGAPRAPKQKAPASAA